MFLTPNPVKKKGMKTVIVKVLSKLRIVNYFNVEIRSKERITVPVMGGLGYGNVFGTEKWMSSVLKKLLKRSEGCFVDVGVNIGQTLIKVKSIDRDIDYLGFEPNPVCVFYAEKLIDLNKFPNTKIIPAGVSNNNEIVTLKYFSTDTTDSSASIVDNFRPYEKVVQERSIVVLNSDTIKIDKKIAILKIDVEGYELMVVEGLKKFIVRDRPYIMIEVLPVYSAEYQDRLDRQRAILKIVNDLNYAVLKVMKNPDDTLKEVVRIPDIGIHGDITHCDYLFIPDEAVAEVLAIVNNA